MERYSGVLMPVFSLPSRYGIGCFSKEAYEFVDFLKEAGQSFWQILPMGPTGYGDSPYQSFSVFAGNPYFIDLQWLISEKALTEEECLQCDEKADKIDYYLQYKKRNALLKKAYDRIKPVDSPEYRQFTEQNSFWLDDYALFMACKEHFGGIEFTLWEEGIKNRKAKAVFHYSEVLSDKIGFHKYIQYRFFSEWRRLKAYANKNGIKIIGDIPIYTSSDSSDVWANRKLFDVDESGKPNNVAGCPPDGFSKDGQLWGNPVYRWSEHKKTGFDWWKKRLGFCFEMYDVLRIDHFRGFDEFYQISCGEETAKNGVWKKAPGYELFSAFEKEFGKKEIIAEDLGFITESVRKLVSDCGYFGMKIFQFAFDERDGGGKAYLPQNYPYNCAAYTGTHDNSTLCGWLTALKKSEENRLREYIKDHKTPCKSLNIAIIKSLMSSRARYAIIPMQDWLGLGDDARINIPSTQGMNWVWRIRKNALSKELALAMKSITKSCDRI